MIIDSPNTEASQYFQVLQRFFNYYRIPLSVISHTGETLYCFPDTDFGYVIPPHLIQLEVNRYHESNLDPLTPFMYSTPYNSLIAIIPLGDDKLLFVGPAFSQPFSISKAENVPSDLFSKPDLKNLERITSKLPLSDESYMADALSMLVLILHYKEIQPRNIIAANKLSIDQRTLLNTNNIIEQEYEKLLVFETQVEYFIESGKMENLEQVWKAFSVSVKGDLTEYLYTEHHFMIPLISSARQAALKTGAPREQVLSIFHSAISQIASRGSLSVNLRIIERTTYEMCSLVKKNKNMPFRTDVCLQCEKYIDEHLAWKITASDLAEHCGVDRSLIFDIFRKNYNVSLNEYIQQEKIRRAKLLLTHSDMPVSEIASILGYCSSSYFSKVFLEYAGTTPAKFRNSASF